MQKHFTFPEGGASAPSCPCLQTLKDASWSINHKQKCFQLSFELSVVDVLSLRDGILW